MNELNGSELLLRLFEEQGLTIRPDYVFAEQGVEVLLDGFDPEQRIGFEFITTEAGDRLTFTPEVVRRLEARMSRGELYLLLLDEAEADPEALVGAARGFFAQLRAMGRLGGAR